MPRRVTILVNDDGTSQIESDVSVGVAGSAPTPQPEQVKAPIEVLKEEFLAAIKRDRKAAFNALGFEKCSAVPESEIAAKIEALRAVTKS
jgi:hypothetical protein